MNCFKDYESEVTHDLRNILSSSSKVSIDTLVLSGGGIKGIVHLGVLKMLEETGIINGIKNFAGTSVGGLICMLYVIGYTSVELWEFINSFNLEKLKSLKPETLFEEYGLDSGKKIHLLLKGLLKNKGFTDKTTMLDLYLRTGISLTLTVTCVNDKKACYISHTTFPNICLLDAARMTMSIPVYYTPVLYKNKYYIDGGCIDNFPIKLYKDNLSRVIGVYIRDRKKETSSIEGLEGYLRETIMCLLEGHSINNIEGYEEFSIIVDTYRISSMDLSISPEKKLKLFNDGYIACKEYISTRF